MFARQSSTILNDAQLVLLVLDQEDGDAYDFLVRRHYQRLYHYAWSLVGDSVEAQDLTQEAFLKAQTSLHALQEPAKFLPWLRRILFSLAMDWQRQYRPAFSRYLGEPDAQAETPLDQLLRTELVQQIDAATQQLPTHYRVPFTLYHLESLGYEAIAETLGLPLGTVKALLHRARKRMQRQLRPYVKPAPRRVTLSLDFDTLPSQQGWSYQCGYEFLPGGPAEERVWSVASGVLSMDTADLFPDVHSYYVLYGVVDPSRPFVLSLRARKLRETARYPEYRLPLRPPAGPVRSSGFCVDISTGTESYSLSLSLHQTRIFGNLVTDQFDNRQFHEYQLEVTPGTGYRLYVGGQYLTSGPPRYHANKAPEFVLNRIAFGDTSATAGNAQVQINKLSFAQLRPEEAEFSPDERDDPAEQLIRQQPFATKRRARPPVAVEKLDRAAEALRRTIRQHSRKWRLGPNGVIVPQDFRE